MSDVQSFYAPNRPAATVPTPRPREHLWAIRRNSRQYDCELLDHGTWGIQVQVLGNLEWFYLMSGDYARAEETTGVWLRDRPASIYARITQALPAVFTGDLDIADERLAAAVKQ